MSEIERIAAEDFVHRSYAERPENDIARLRTENQIRAQEYAALLGLWKGAQERLEKAERVVKAARWLAALCNTAAIIYTMPTLENAKDDVFSTLAQYDSHAEQKETP